MRWLRVKAGSRIDRPFGSICSNNLEIVVRLFRFLIFDVLLPDFIGDIAAGGHPISPRPKMLTPVALPQRLVLRQKLMGTLSLQVLHRARHRKMRRNREQQMNMVTVYRPGMDRYLVATADFTQQFPCSQPDIPNQNRVSIFGHPYEMIFTIPYRVAARFRRLHDIKDATASLRLKPSGFRILTTGL